MAAMTETHALAQSGEEAEGDATSRSRGAFAVRGPSPETLPRRVDVDGEESQ